MAAPESAPEPSTPPPVSDAAVPIARRIAAIDDPYLRERSHDVEFVGERLLRALMGAGGVEGTIPKLAGRAVLVGHDLSPADTAGLVTEPVVGFVTDVGVRSVGVGVGGSQAVSRRRGTGVARGG